TSARSSTSASRLLPPAGKRLLRRYLLSEGSPRPCWVYSPCTCAQPAQRKGSLVIERQIKPEVAAIFTEVARGRGNIYRDDEAFESLLADAKAALIEADPETVELIEKFARAE